MRRKNQSIPALLGILVQLSSLPFAVGSNSYGIEMPTDCAQECKLAGYNPKTWLEFESESYFERCSWDPALFTYSLELPAPRNIRACVELGDDESTTNEGMSDAVPAVLRCKVSLPLPGYETEIFRRPAANTAKIVPGQVIGAGSTIKSALLRGDSGNMTQSSSEGQIIHAHYGDAIVGVFIGSKVDKFVFAEVVEEFISSVQEHGIGQTFRFQHCGENTTASSVFGIVADTSSGMRALSSVRSDVSAWSRGICAESDDNVSIPETRSSAPGSSHVPPAHGSNWTGVEFGEKAINRSVRTSDLLQNNRLAMGTSEECSTIEVVSGDNCGSLVSKCGPDFERWNSKKANLCSTLAIGQRVCCSPGDLPDI